VKEVKREGKDMRQQDCCILIWNCHFVIFWNCHFLVQIYISKNDQQTSITTANF
jgi:hypothetical protein